MFMQDELVPHFELVAETAVREGQEVIGKGWVRQEAHYQLFRGSESLETVFLCYL